MCGILGVAVSESKGVHKRLKAIYKNQETRGRQGGGIALMRGHTIQRLRNQNPANTLKEFASWQGFKDGDLILFHHRLPTSTPNKSVLNHPIANEDKTIYLIHNGYITNDGELFKKLRKTHQFETTFKKKGKDRIITDTEVMVHILEEELRDSDLETAFYNMAKRVEGYFAIAVLIKGYDKIFLFKNSNPIVVFKDKQGNHYFASEYPSKNGFKKIKELADGEFGFIDHKGYTEVKTFEDLKPTRKYYFSWESSKTDQEVQSIFGWDGRYYGEAVRFCSMCKEGIAVKGKHCKICAELVDKDKEEKNEKKKSSR
jgi:glucosamine--fructose-6-phosphate aminotransferase (isomerizing)